MLDFQTMDMEKSNSPISFLPLTLSVYSLLRELEDNPEIWNQYPERTSGYKTPHTKVSDVWVRYNARENLTKDWDSFHNKHTSVWYPVIEKIPSIVSIVEQVYKEVGGKELGGIFITKVPAGEIIDPHVDGGWHPEYYEKYAVQIKGNLQQAFCFDGFSLSALPGQVYTFDNSKVHWVVNGSNEDRITLIICLRR